MCVKYIKRLTYCLFILAITACNANNQRVAENYIIDMIHAAGQNTKGPVNDIAADLGIKYPPRNKAVAKHVEEWLTEYGESIYGTTAGPVPPQPWGVTTKKCDTIYVHILINEGEKNSEPTPSFGYIFKFLIKLPIDRDDIESCKSLDGSARTGIRKIKHGGTAIAIDKFPDSTDTILKIILKQHQSL